MLTAHDGAFYEGKDPVFLFGGECHYFRIDPSDWRDRLLKIRAAGCNLVSTYVPWLWHEMTPGQTDFTGYSHPRRNLVGFLNLCNELGLYVIVRPGPYVMSELRQEGIPGWVHAQYPEVIARTRAGGEHPTGVVSYLHPTFLLLAESWYRAVLEVMKPWLADKGGPIILVQLDNEIGMLHWVTSGADYHPMTLARYETYLQNVESANGGGVIDAPEAPGDHDADLRAHFLWAAFCRDEIAQYVAFLAKVATKVGITVPYLINVHGFKDFSVYSRGTDYPIGVSQLRTAAKRSGCLVAGDFYPGHLTYDNFHDVIVSTLVTAAISDPGQPLFSAEFQSGRLSDRPTVSREDLGLLTRLCVAHGMNAMNYYMFCAGDNPEDIGLFGTRHEWQAPIASDGTLRPPYSVAAQLGHLLKSVGQSLCAAPKVIDTHVAFYSPYYMTETLWSPAAAESNLVHDFAFQREQYHFDGIWRLLSAVNISFSMLDVYEQQDIDPRVIPSLWFATTTRLDARTQRVLVKYVRDGGDLIMGPQVPLFDLDGSDCRVLADTMGVSVRDQKTGYRLVRLVDIPSVFCRQHLVLENTGSGEVWGCEEADLTKGVAALHRLGEGRVLVLGVGLTHEYGYQVDVMRAIASRMGITQQIACSHPHALVTLREGATGSFVSLVNVTADDIVTRVMVRGRYAFGSEEILVPARTGALLPLDYRISGELSIVYCTAEVTVQNVSDTSASILVAVTGEEIVMQLSQGWKVSQAPGGCQIEVMDGRFRVTVAPAYRLVQSEAQILLEKNLID